MRWGIIAVAAAACGASPKPKPAPQSTIESHSAPRSMPDWRAGSGPRPWPENVLATVEHRSLFGDSTLMVVYRDGALEYHGNGRVERRGKHTGKISAGDLERLKAAFETARFFDLEPSYGTCGLDCDSTEVTYHLDGKHMSVSIAPGSPRAPEVLRTLLSDFDD